MTRHRGIRIWRPKGAGLWMRTASLALRGPHEKSSGGLWGEKGTGGCRPSWRILNVRPDTLCPGSNSRIYLARDKPIVTTRYHSLTLTSIHELSQSFVVIMHARQLLKGERCYAECMWIRIVILCFAALPIGHCYDTLQLHRKFLRLL